MILYQTEDGKTKIEVRLEDKTVWLSQHMMADLFKATKKISACISKMSLRNVFKEGELPEKRVVKECLTTATDDKNYRAKSYNLEAIISVGCRVKSHRGTQFRKWATEMLNEYLVKGFTMDDERPKARKKAKTSVPTTLTNCLLSFLYTIVMHDVRSASDKMPSIFMRKNQNRPLKLPA